MAAWITAEQALEHLGTARQTLYANVSRGRIRSRPHPADPRRNLYNAEDVRRLAARSRGRRRTAALAAETMKWGEPILASAVSTVVDGRLVYRGEDAVALADTASLEEVAGLLWQGDPVRPASGAARGRTGTSAPVEAALVMLAHRAAIDPSSAGRSQRALRAEAAGLIANLAVALAGPGDDSLHHRLAEAWHQPQAADLLRRALVLLADHELNASTFACRVAISTGAPLSGGLLAGLSTLNGPLHGGASSAAFALVDHAREAGAVEAVRTWLVRGQPIPAMGHALYPRGDARAAALLAAFEPPPVYLELVEAADHLLGERPNVDFALAALTDFFGLPRSAPLTLFALARSVGWAAHALEQAASGTLIRPRARYSGPRPA